MPESLQEIGNRAFCDCNSLLKLHLGSNLQTIGNGAFSGCGFLEEITIPASVKSIGAGAFGQNMTYKYIDRVNMLGDTPPIMGSQVFGSLNNPYFYVPKGCGEIYKQANSWEEYPNIVDDEVFLHINLPNGNVKVGHLDKRDAYLHLEPQDGYRVHSISLDNENVTHLLDDNNYITVSRRPNSASLNVVFEENIETAVLDASKSSITVTSFDGCINVNGLQDHDKVSIFNLEGQIVSQKTGSGQISCPTGIYIVKIKDRAFKVIL